MPDDDQYFTLVFKGDLRGFKFNPLKAETVFGTPIAAAIGDALFTVDKLLERAEAEE